MIKTRDFLEYSFAYTDEFGQEFKLESKLVSDTANDMSHLELMIDQFNNFLKGAGWIQQVILSE